MNKKDILFYTAATTGIAGKIHSFLGTWKS